ncbi:MAG: hypothetical protein OSJ59_07050, partial [Lachnospiraceae bacterium]|nr:hypothetical protein [Lachnospiraceae bacterium]
MAKRRKRLRFAFGVCLSYVNSEQKGNGGESMLKSIKPKKWVVAAYLAVPVALCVFTVFAPLVAALFYSFFEWKGGPVKT